MRSKSKKSNPNTSLTCSASNKNKNTNVKKTKSSETTKDSVDNDDTASAQKEVLENFNLELKWCLQQLEGELSSKNCKNVNKAEGMNRCYRILINPKNPMIKKRQAMRSYFGDYRQKMTEEAQKFNFGSTKVSNSGKVPPSSLYLKRSSVSLNQKPESGETKKNLFGEGSKNDFKFNFQTGND
ncbi:UNVERIFIED_CONTAM: hypothetical protein RMT77_004178 [Armadillidium vulgare]